MSNDYIPKKDADFDNWFKNLVDYVNSKCSPPDAPPVELHPRR